MKASLTSGWGVGVMVISGQILEGIRHLNQPETRRDIIKTSLLTHRHTEEKRKRERRGCGGARVPLLCSYDLYWCVYWRTTPPRSLFLCCETRKPWLDTQDIVVAQSQSQKTKKELWELCKFWQREIGCRDCSGPTAQLFWLSWNSSNSFSRALPQANAIQRHAESQKKKKEKKKSQHSAIPPRLFQLASKL